MIITTSLRVS
ncbi:hypothetical protein MIMGU_mgv1a0112062mg, partial [Erythranthe guttata]